MALAEFALSLFITYDLIAIHLEVTPCPPNTSASPSQRSW
jgi:hypothetical protein